MKRWIMLAAGLVIGATACTDNGGPGAGAGSTRVLLTDAPFPYDDVSKVEIHIVRIEASTSEDTIPGTGNWVTIASPDRTFDLLQLQAGATALAGTVDLPAGTYRAVRVTINTTLSRVTMADHSIATVQWPVNGELQLNTLVQYALDVPAGGSNIVIDFDLARSFLLGFSGGFVFSPWLRAVNDAVTGTISGTVTSGGVPVANASVTAYRGNADNSYSWWEVTSGRSDAQGHYALTYLPGAEYHVYASHFSAGAQVKSIAVSAGQTATVNLAVVDDPLPPQHPDSTVVPPDSGAGVPSGPVFGVTVSPAAQSVAVNDSLGLYAALVNAQGQLLSGRSVTFATSDAAVVSITATFGQSALLKAKAPGTVTITATSEGKVGTATVTVH